MNMNQTTSPALSQVETAIRGPAGNFAKYNYYSVFDIVRQTRKQFINANMSWPGSRGGKARDLAMGQAQYIRCLFRENQLTRRVRGGPAADTGQWHEPEQFRRRRYSGTGRASAGPGHPDGG